MPDATPMIRRAALLLVAFAALAARAEPFSYERVQVADGVFAFVERFGHAIVSGNSVAIVGDNGVVVVDTGHHPDLTRKMIAEIRRITAKPVLYVVNTHWHADHVSGNFVYAEEYPGVKFIAHEFTAKLIGTEAEANMGPGCQAFLREQTKPLRDMVRSGVGPDGKPIPEARIARLREVLDDADAANGECMQIRFPPTDIAFQDRLALHLGKREVQVMFLGRANTAGDAVVYIPDVKVAAIGDILVHPFPFATQSYIGEWAAVLRRIEAMDTAAIVPGHGPVMRDKKYLVEIAGLMESIDSQARKAYEPGIALADLRKRVDISGFRGRIAGEDRLLQVNFDAMADSAVARAWQSLRGAMEPEGLPKH
jgi:glyoxylase-like metal-dependent hydrolase (beta-lactamase superfamily II)